ncbi:DEAD/DEAH box helicase [Salana multivorans]
MRQLIELLGLVGAGSYQRGLALARQHRASVHTFDQADGWVQGVVDGDTGVYRTQVSFMMSSNDVIIEFDGACSCPVHMDCKHAVALLLTALEEESIARDAGSGHDSAWREILHRALPTAETPEVELALAITVTPPGQGGRFGYGFKNGRVSARPVRSGKRTRWVQTGLTWSTIRTGHLPGADRHQLVALERLRRLAMLEDRYYADPNVVELDQVPLPELWPALREVVASGVRLIDARAVGQGAPRNVPVVVIETEPARAGLAVLEEDDGDLVLHASLEHPALDDSTAPVLVGDPPHGVVWVGESATHLAQLEQVATPTWVSLRDSGTVRVPARERSDFEREFAPRLAAHGWRSPDGSYEAPPPPRPVLHLGVRIEERGDPSTPPRAVLGWGWVYGDDDAAPAATWLPVVADPRFTPETGRDGAAEQEMLERVLGVLGPVLPGLLLVPEGRRSPPALLPEATLVGLDVVRLLELVPTLAAEGVVVHHDELPQYRESAAPSVTISVAKESRDWFELEVAMDVAGHSVPIGQVITALATRQNTLFLPDGSYVSLDLPELEQLRQLIAESRALADGRRSALRVPRINASWWEELLALGIVQAAEHAWLQAVQRHAGDRAGEGGAAPADDPPPVPSGLRATLRPYQREGFEWLATLRRAGLGGVLADDMGLGKTVQTLAMILDEREHPGPAEPPGPDQEPVATPSGEPGEKRPWLVVAPTSVVPNWAAEAARFTPELPVAVVSATGARRAETLAELAVDADIIVTSYALLRLEAAEYAALDLAGVILDEAQNVKNYTSKAFASARRLGAPVTFVITGTPMENDLSELWAMFTLTSPGLLGNPQQFGEVYRRPIERGSPESGALLARLRRRIRPFLLRRTKEQVATDLPPKQEQVLRVDLAPAHRRLYDRHLQRERRRILRLADDLEGNRVEVLAALTRLRQLAIDASLVDAHAGKDGAAPVDDVPSSKLDVLLPLLQEAAAEGHRVLVFSQFTRYLRLIAQRLEAEGLGYAYLDGATTRRSAVIQGFADGDDPVFLISLKAGGVGLNLTMADYAILADPWWNPAAEAQAVDRAHRIGQERPVMVYRLVASNTIEERVMALQEAKRALVAGVLDEDGGASAVAAAAPGTRAGTAPGARRGAGKLSAEDLRSLLA